MQAASGSRLPEPCSRPDLEFKAASLQKTRYQDFNLAQNESADADCCVHISFHQPNLQMLFLAVFDAKKCCPSFGWSWDRLWSL